jgi:hypothetical protein
LTLSVTAVRGIVLGANLLLLGGIGLLCQDTFFADKEAEYRVAPYKNEFDPIYDEKKGGFEKDQYLVVARAFEREKKGEPPPPPPPPKPDAPPAGPNLAAIKVAAINWSEDTPFRSVFLNPPGSAEPISFRQDNELGERAGFESFKSCKVKEIKKDGVILTDPKGKETEVKLKVQP